MKFAMPVRRDFDRLYYGIRKFCLTSRSGGITVEWVTQA